MLNKKILFATATLLLLPSLSAKASAMDDDDLEPVYFKLAYQGTYVGNQKIYDAKKATKSTTKAVVSEEEYKPKYKNGLLAGALGVGKYLTQDTRAEFEIFAADEFKLDGADDAKNEFFGYTGTEYDEAGFKNKGFNLALASMNLYYEVNSESTFVPYIAGGLGIARVKFMSDPTAENITYPVAAQFRAGVKFTMNNVMPVYLGYKLVYLASNEAGDAITATLKKSTDPAKTKKLKTSYMLHSVDLGIMMLV